MSALARHDRLAACFLLLYPLLHRAARGNGSYTWAMGVGEAF